jgi:hypothetical protein
MGCNLSYEDVGKGRNDGWGIITMATMVVPLPTLVFCLAYQL